jgi:hypothetical protein
MEADRKVGKISAAMYTIIGMSPFLSCSILARDPAFIWGIMAERNTVEGAIPFFGLGEKDCVWRLTFSYGRHDLRFDDIPNASKIDQAEDRSAV